jgi:hypothetical protein
MDILISVNYAVTEFLHLLAFNQRLKQNILLDRGKGQNDLLFLIPIQVLNFSCFTYAEKAVP